VASWPAKPTGFRVDLPHKGSHALHPGPYPPDLSRWNSYGALTTDSSRTPSRLACRTRTVWQYQHAPSLSGLLPTLPGISRVRLPSAPIESLRRLGGGVLSSPHGHEAPRGARFPRSAHARCDRGGRPLYPEASGVHTTSESIPVAACRLYQRPGLTTRVFVPSFRALRYEASQGVYLRSPVRSSPRPVAPRTERGPLGFSLELRTPSRQDPSGARRGGD